MSEVACSWKGLGAVKKAATNPRMRSSAGGRRPSAAARRRSSRTHQAQDRDHEVAQRRERLWHPADAGLGAVLVERSVLHIVTGIVDQPRNELDRIHLVSFLATEGTVSQRSETTARQRAVFGALKLAAPPLFFDFTPALDLDEVG